MTRYLTNNYTVTNLHKKPSVRSEILTQMIYGDSFSILNKTRKWLKVKIKEDGYKGYIKNKNFSGFLKSTHKINTLKAKAGPASPASPPQLSQPSQGEAGICFSVI